MLEQRVRLLTTLAVCCIGFVNAEILVFSESDPHKVEQVFRDMPARFGGFIPPDEGIKGLLVYADPPTACSDINGPPKDANFSGSNWIVLIARLNCTFEEKIRFAQKAGYNAAIVHNVNSDDLEQMSAKDPTNIKIPSVFVGEYTGLYLQSAYRYDEGFFLLINDQPININTHLLLPFAIVVGICFLVMVTFMVVRCIKDRRRARRHRLPNSSLKKIPIHKYTKGDPYETCAICLEDYIENEKLRVLPCAHAYHTKCIDPWLTKNRRVCPVCKRKVFAADERVESDSDSDSDADDSTPLIRESNRPGTQGGTFTPQSENPFWRPLNRARRAASSYRRGSQSSGSSYHSNPSDVNPNDEEEEEAVGGEELPVVLNEPEASNSGSRRTSRTVLMASDSHSINSELPELEKSVSSTRPHTVNLSVQIEDNSLRDTRPTVSIALRDEHDVVI